MKLSFRKESFQLHFETHLPLPQHHQLRKAWITSQKLRGHQANLCKFVWMLFVRGFFVHPPISRDLCWANLLQRREKYHDIHLIGFFENTQSRMKDPYGCFLKWGYPKMDDLQQKSLLKWMIWGYHHFRKHSNLPNGKGVKNICERKGTGPSNTKGTWGACPGSSSRGPRNNPLIQQKEATL